MSYMYFYELSDDESYFFSKRTLKLAIFENIIVL